MVEGVAVGVTELLSVPVSEAVEVVLGVPVGVAELLTVEV